MKSFSQFMVEHDLQEVPGWNNWWVKGNQIITVGKNSSHSHYAWRYPEKFGIRKDFKVHYEAGMAAIKKGWVRITHSGGFHPTVQAEAKKGDQQTIKALQNAIMKLGLGANKIHLDLNEKLSSTGNKYNVFDFETFLGANSPSQLREETLLEVLGHNNYWLDLKTGKLISIGKNMVHEKYALRNPDKFGVDVKDLQKGTGDAKYELMKRGWARMSTESSHVGFVIEVWRMDTKVLKALQNALMKMNANTGYIVVEWAESDFGRSGHATVSITDFFLADNTRQLKRMAEESMVIKKNRTEFHDDVPANAMAHGNIATWNPLLKPRPERRKKDYFAGHRVFEVDRDQFVKGTHGKPKYKHWKKYVGNEENGEEIRQFANKNPKKPVLVKDSKTGIMTFLRHNKIHNYRT